MNRLIKSVLILIIILLSIVVISSNRFSYAFDYEFNALTKECTYKTYVQNKNQCIRKEYRD